jgi:hypothetical protein
MVNQLAWALFTVLAGAAVVVVMERLELLAGAGEPEAPLL